MAFIGEVIDDAVARFALDRAHVLLTGFSRGGSLVWDIACQAPAMASAYAAIAGGFWRPHPTSRKGRSGSSTPTASPTTPCPSKGGRSAAVPEQGGPSRLQLWRRTNGCKRADWQDASGPYWRKA
ncbi:MAG: hypothetical protein R3C69_04705 [Geminicoccaceae bacterium]